MGRDKANRRAFVGLFAAASLAVACSSSSGAPPGPSAPAEETLGGARPLVTLRVPASYDRAKPAPLVLVLHGYGVGGAVQAAYFGLSFLVEEEGFILAAPDGTRDAKGHPFWNALDFCCGTGVDDVAYLLGLVGEIERTYSIDKKRIYLVGHSNGAAMAYRLACDAADRFAAVVSLGGTFYNDPSKCKPTSPVAVREMHGTADETLPYDGGYIKLPSLSDKVDVPSAASITGAWAGYNGCGAASAAEALDLDLDVAGPETRVSRYSSCRAGADVELLSMAGTKHVPFNLTKDLARVTYAFLKAHPKLP